MYKIGAVTIGQSPRSDVIADIRPILGSEVDVVEAGALDGLTKEEIAKLFPKEGDYVLVTRLRDGTSVKVAERYITPLLQDKISNLFESGIPVVLLLCTGNFPNFPQGVAHKTTKDIIRGHEGHWCRVEIRRLYAFR